MSAAAKTDGAHTAYVGLGSNVEPEKNLPRAIRVLAEKTDLVVVSSVWLAPAVGNPAPDFLNAAAKIRTPLSANELKEKILRPMEAQLGRQRGPDKFAPRPIDLDIVIFDEECLDADLWELAHLAVPLAAIYPNYFNATTGEMLQETANRLETKSKIAKQALDLRQFLA